MYILYVRNMMRLLSLSLYWVLRDILDIFPKDDEVLVKASELNLSNTEILRKMIYFRKPYKSM